MINIIVAMDKQGLIGANGSLPWKIKKDLEYFKEKTMGHTVVMGRKTWDSLPIIPLPGRKNIILSRIPVDGSNTKWYTSIDEILKLEEEIFIIGGAQIYKQFYPLADKLYITYVNDKYEGDTYFPIKPPQINEDFEIESRKIDKENNCEFIIMKRIDRNE